MHPQWKRPPRIEQIVLIPEELRIFVKMAKLGRIKDRETLVSRITELSMVMINSFSNRFGTQVNTSIQQTLQLLKVLWWEWNWHLRMRIWVFSKEWMKSWNMLVLEVERMIWVLRRGLYRKRCCSNKVVPHSNQKCQMNSTLLFFCDRAGGSYHKASHRAIQQSYVAGRCSSRYCGPCESYETVARRWRSVHLRIKERLMLNDCAEPLSKDDLEAKIKGTYVTAQQRRQLDVSCNSKCAGMEL